MRMDQLTDRLPSIIVINDDICIFGSTPHEHILSLLRLIKTAECNGTVFNSKKCTIWQSLIPFYGTVFTQHGMKFDLEKVQPLEDFPTTIN